VRQRYTYQLYIERVKGVKKRKKRLGLGIHDFPECVDPIFRYTYACEYMFMNKNVYLYICKYIYLCVYMYIYICA